MFFSVNFSMVMVVWLIKYSRYSGLNNVMISNYLLIQVSTVTDQPGLLDLGASTGDLDDEDGGGLVNNSFSSLHP